jgi:hypothetical protein
MGVASQHQSDLDSLAVAGQLDLLDAPDTVLPSKLLGSGACTFDDTWVGNDLWCGRASHHVEVRHRLRRRLDSGLTRPLRPRGQNDALLRRAKTDHGSRCDRERKYDRQRRLTAFVA